MSDFVTVAGRDEIPSNGLIGRVVGEQAIVLVEQDGEIFALEDRCSHEEFPLSSGECDSGEITCVLHGARFNIVTGAPTALPAVMPVKTFEVRIEGDDVQVKLDG